MFLGINHNGVRTIVQANEVFNDDPLSLPSLITDDDVTVMKIETEPDLADFFDLYACNGESFLDKYLQYRKAALALGIEEEKIDTPEDWNFSRKDREKHGDKFVEVFKPICRKWDEWDFVVVEFRMPVKVKMAGSKVVGVEVPDEDSVQKHVDSFSLPKKGDKYVAIFGSSVETIADIEWDKEGFPTVVLGNGHKWILSNFTTYWKKV